MEHIRRTVYMLGRTPDSTRRKILKIARTNAIRYKRITMFNLFHLHKLHIVPLSHGLGIIEALDEITSLRFEPIGYLL